MTRTFFSQRYFSLAVICSMAMVAYEVTPWMALFAFGLLVWKWGAEKYQWPLLSRRWTGALSVLLLAQVLLQFRTIIGQEPSYTLLVGLSALRVMDYGNDRDHKFVVLLSFILISVKALFSIDIYWVVPSAFSFWGLWYSLLPEKVPARGKALVRIFVLSTPLAVLLFFGFPRLVIPWALSRGSAYGQIGFTDELNP
ncbi:MAG: DUF3488 domain-containing protein, partial [Bdellovibrio sp.]|nr:DUF3488 domain-containing protein [Bdellovibrio sp.]